MEYTVGGVTFTFTEDASGNVVNIKSDNAAVILLIGEGGITFTPFATVLAAQGFAAYIVSQI